MTFELQGLGFYLFQKQRLKSSEHKVNDKKNWDIFLNLDKDRLSWTQGDNSQEKKYTQLSLDASV